MSDVTRRGFVGAATSVRFVGVADDDGKDFSFINNVPDPDLSGDELLPSNSSSKNQPER